jgi:hypothetical protein
MNHPRVTVLLAVHNGGAYLREAVGSVLAQTLEDFELLLVDDGSTDGAVESLPEDARIRVLRNDRNIGQIPSLNRGLREATGAYVARLDHDDVCLPRRLEAEVEALDAMTEVALVSTWVDIVDSDGRLWTRISSEVGSYVDFLARVTVGDVPLVHPAIMFRRDVVLRLGGFDESLGAAEDQDLYRRLALAGHSAYVVPERLLIYRRHEEQMTFAQASMVNRNNEVGHDRFLAELAPGLPATTIRMLLTRDPRFWNQDPLPTDVLERLVELTSLRQELSAADAHTYAQRLATRVAGTLVGGWAAGARRYGASAQPVVPFVRRHGTPAARASLAGQPVLRATAPLGRPVAAARLRTLRVLRSRELEPIRRVARRSRLLRRIYTKTLGFRLVDD